jgi:hypothetical protein
MVDARLRHCLPSREGFRAIFALHAAAVLRPHAFGADTYAPSTRQLTIPAAAIGNASYRSMVVTVGNSDSRPPGTTANAWHKTLNPSKAASAVRSTKLGAAIIVHIRMTPGRSTDVVNFVRDYSESHT